MEERGILLCENKGCDIEYLPKTHNQKYCSDECCRLATNRRIMEKYYAKRDQRKGKIRWCAKCKTTKLSRYNDSLICSACKTKTETDANSSVVNMLLNTSFTA